MDGNVFWEVIGRYNESTVFYQIAFLVMLLASLAVSYTGKIRWMAKVALGVANLFIGIAFFASFGTEPIQRYFALPLYLSCGALFIYKGIRNRADKLQAPSKWQWILLILYALYPLVSFLLGGRFPQMVTPIMPCPVISLSIVVYAGYERKNKLLLLLMAIWGLTGVKSILFHAYEDIILLICGLYCVCLLIKECRSKKKSGGASYL